MDAISRFIPMDRRQALAAGTPLPTQMTGAVLLTDLAGYTALISAFAGALGPQAGGEAAFRALAPCFANQIETIHDYRGSVLGFSGDALTAWFDGDDGARALAAAAAIQTMLGAAPPLPLPDGSAHALTVKCVIAAGPARRFLVGDPALGLIDVLAGAPPALAGLGEHLAAGGEILLEEGVAATLGATGTGRRDEDSGARFLVVATAPPAPREPSPWPALPPGALAEADLRPWVPPVLWPRLLAGETFQVELRPTVALFLRFAGIDYARPTAAARLDTYIRAVQAILARFGGTLLQLTVGDKGNYLYASFGAPVAHEDNAARAAAAALALRTPPAACPYIQSVQIGLASGAVYAGPYGSPAAQTYSARGDSVNLGARLMQAAGPGSILGTREVRQATGGRFAWTALPPLLVKGKAAPLAVYGLQGARELGLSELHYATPLVGRAAEQAALAAALQRATAGQGQVVGLVGEAGLGKSRLVAAAVRAARVAGFTVYGGAGESYGTQTAYLAWQGIWQAFFDLDPGGTADEQALELADRLAALDPALTERLPLLGAALGIALPDTELTAPWDAKQRQESRTALLLECLQARARAGPVLLVLEDAHWLDPLSHDLLEAVGRAIPLLPVLVLVAYRPPEIDRLAAPRVSTLPHFTELALTALPEAALAELALGRLPAGGQAVAPAVSTALAQRAEGNPFYLEELVAYLLEQGVDLTTPAALGQVAWPASLQSLLLARIDQVTEAQRTVLKVASIVGRRFAVRHLWGVHLQLGPAPQVDGDLSVLAAAGLTPLESVEPERVHAFRHAVTQEVTYSSLPGAVRAALHGQFADWLEAEGGADLDLLAYHYGQSANVAKRRYYLQRAGDAAAAAWANVAAAGYYERLLAELPAGHAGRGPVLRALGDVLERQGAWAAAAGQYRAARAAGAPAGDHAAAAWGLGVVCHRQGAYADAVTWLEQARAEFAADGDAAGAARVQAELGRVYQLQGEYPAANAVLAAARAAALAAGDRATEARALNNLGLVAHAQGEYTAAQALFAASLELREALGDRWGIAMSRNNLGLVAHEQGEYRVALAYHTASLELRQALGDRWGITMSRNNLARVLYEQGDFAAARALMEENLALQRELGDRWGSALTLNNLGELAHERGEFPVAQTMFTESLASSREVGDRWGIAMSLANLGRVALDQGAWSTAQRFYEESLALSRALGAREDIAMALTSLGRVALEQGAVAEAQARLAESLDLARVLGPGQTTRNALIAVAVASRPAAAARLLGAVAGLLAAQGSTLQPDIQRRYAQAVAQARAGLGDGPYAAAFAAGQALSWAEAVDAAHQALGALS